MENEDGQSVSKNEIDNCKKADSSSEETALKKCTLDAYGSCKLKVSLIKLNHGMPEQSGGPADSEKDLQECSAAASEKKINGEVATESDNSLPKQNGSAADVEMAPLSIDVDESVEEGRGAENSRVESGLKRKLEDSTKLQDSSSSDEEAHSNSPVEFRGFKKRMIAKAEKTLHRQRQASETEYCPMTPETTPEEDSSVAEPENTRVLRSSTVKSKASDKEESGDQLTEYAQYLGLQPTVKFKCYRCGENNFQTMASLNEHHTNCSKANSGRSHTAAAAKPLLSSQDSNPSTNFRITRKVYLCSACGTYYENWKLFLHMRDVHKRHICLYCLGMFAVADKLAEHLVLKHKITYHTCNSPEQFLNISKGSGYLTCLTCERMFTERENFFDHECRAATVTNALLCAKEPTQTRPGQPDTNRNSQSAGSSTVTNQSGSSAATKRFVSVPTLVRENWSGKPITIPRTSEFIDASSFCHVDLVDTHTDARKPSSSISTENHPIVVIDDDDDDEPTQLNCDKRTESTLQKTSPQKAISKMFPTLKKLSDLMENKDVEVDTSRVEVEKPAKEDVSNDLDKNRNPNTPSQSKTRKQTQNRLPQRTTRSSARVADMNSLDKKRKTEIALEHSSSSDSESMDMDVATTKEAIGKQVFTSGEDDSDSNDAAKKTATWNKCGDRPISRRNAQKDKHPKQTSNSSIEKTEDLIAHSPPLFMEVVNESDNESLEEEPESDLVVNVADVVHTSSKVEEIEKTTEANKPRIEEEDDDDEEVVDKNQQVNVEENSKIEDNDKVREEKDVDVNNEEEAIDKNKKEDKFQVEEDKFASVSSESSNFSAEEHVVQQTEKNSDSAEKQVGKNSESAEKQVEKNIDSVEKQVENNSDSSEKQVENNSDSSEKQVEKHSDSAEKPVEKNSGSEERQVEKNSDSTLPNGPLSSSQEKSIVPYEDSEEDEEDDSDEDQPPKKIEESNVEQNGDGSNMNGNNSDVQHNNDVGSDLENNRDESGVDDNEDESGLEHNKDEDDVENYKDDDDKSKEESKDGNNDEQNDFDKTNVAQPANDSSENNKSSHDEDNRSVDSDDSDKLSVVLSGDSSDNGNSKSEDEDNVNRKDTKSNDDDNVGNSESESQSMTNHSQELLNGRDDESECQKEADNAIETSFSFEGETMQIASREVMAMALTLDDKMESLSAQSVIKECIRTSCTSCGYCNHAVKIAVNGKQLAAHLLAEHRYKPVKNETVDDVIDRLKQALSQLKDVWFNTDSYDSSDKSCFVPFDHTYECFQCNFVINTLKDLINHKRKVHQKTILYCSMCKANFYSYSELLCHMCPGVYVSEDIQFRCCFCDVDRIPSAFRLMVHLRKTHHTCDICLEIPGDQQKLSTHMWKHKLHHICYRCGIAYRNKPDITKHLFWKHGTESVLCKKCLQKKWPHVYHFCIPPTVFICEECNISFSKAVALKVHKRIHANDFPYSCTECSKKFVSRKILDKHIQSHNEPIVQEETDKNVIGTVSNKSDECKEAEPESQSHPTCDNRESEQVQIDKKTAVADQEQDQQQSGEHSSKSHKKKSKKDRDKRSKPVVDVYDLPPLNLSSESDDSDDEMNSSKTNDNNATAAVTSSNSALPSLPLEPIKDADAASNVEKHSSVEKMDASDSNMNSAAVAEPPDILNISDDSQSAPIVDGIWDNFHSYKAEQEKREGTDPSSKTPSLANSVCEMPERVNTSAILADHDYCFVPTPSHPTPASLHSSSMDHDYCTSSVNNKRSNHAEIGNQYAPQTERKYSATTPKKKQKSPKKSEKQNSSSSSDSSSDTDSSSCSNSNCSCCSSASGSSSSSTSDSDSSSSEGKRGKRDRKKEKTKSKKKDDSVTVTAAPNTSVVQEEEPVVDLPVEPEEPPIRESDLDTNESSTEEDFYDQYPQRHANQMLAEKRNQLMVLATVAPVNNGIASPPPPPEQTPISAPPLPLEETLPKPSPVQRRGRKKRRRGRAPTKNQSNPANPSPLTYESQPSTSFGRTPPPTTPTPNSAARKKARPSVDTDSSKRLSKRRRVPNKFYGYSSDEEEEMQQAQPATVPAAKWRRVEPAPAPAPAATTPVAASPEGGYHPRLSIKQHYDDNPVQYSSGMPVAAAAASSSAGGSSSSGSGSESSGSDSDSESEPIAPPPAVVVNPPRTDKDEKLYCYCQCPYDEVSEMIACDGSDCHIEWFHFECVGIMVPPKGKWYCPDCKRRRNLI